MKHNSQLAALEKALQSGSPEMRVEALRRITGLFLDDSDHLSEKQIAVFDDLLVHLIERVESRALVQLAKALAPIDNAPIEATRQLSRHDEIEVAGPVLMLSSRLTESDLVEVAKSKGQGHLLAMSQRASLSEAVTDALVARGDGDVFVSLAKNSQARFSESGYATLVERSQHDPSLAENLSLRLDISLELLKRLLSRATDLVRSRLLAIAAPENKEKVQAALASVVDEIQKEAAGPRDYKRANSKVFELNRLGKLNDQALAEFVQNKMYEEMAATIALFCGTKSEVIDSLLKSASSDGIIIACKAGKISWATAQQVLQVRLPNHSPSINEMTEAKNDFLNLSQANAQRTMRFMATQMAAKLAS